VEAGLREERVQQVWRDPVSDVAGEALPAAVAFTGSPEIAAISGLLPGGACRAVALSSASELLDGGRGDEVDEVASGSRNRSDRLPHGIVAGSLTKSSTKPARFWCTPSTSSARNSMITVRLSAGRAAPGANGGTVRVLPIARAAQAVLNSAKSSLDQLTCAPVARS
jgi:hypothetical protein